MIAILPLYGIGEVGLGTDLATLLVGALRENKVVPQQNDIIVVTQKILSKAEGRIVDLRNIRPGGEAERLAAITLKDPRVVELVLAESVEVVRAVPNVLITRHRSGLVMANAGIDRSNAGPGREESALLLPRDADRSAAQLCLELCTEFDCELAVLITDSFGRPWRNGVVNVGIGSAGLPSLIDKRGDCDRDGRTLEVTQVALADLVASAAGLAAGEGAEGIPVVLVRGVKFPKVPVPACHLIRPPDQDLFR